MTHPTVFGGATPPPANYQISNSVRMNGFSNYLTRSPGVPGSRRKWTVSTWIKRSALSNSGIIFASSTSGVDAHWLYYTATNDKLYWQDYYGATFLELRASQVSRDTSAWYHIMAVLDTAQPIASDRAKLYINGELVALDIATYPGQHTDLLLNQTRPHTIGVTNYNGGTLANYFNGYMADFHFIDGQALSPTDFGKFDSNGVWVPIKYTGTYGPNGCKLEFKNAAISGGTSTVSHAGGFGGWTVINQVRPLPNGKWINQIGVNQNSAENGKYAYILRDNGDGTYTVVYQSPAFNHPGAGFYQVGVNYTVPASGTYVMAVYCPGAALQWGHDTGSGTAPYQYFTSSPATGQTIAYAVAGASNTTEMPPALTFTADGLGTDTSGNGNNWTVNGLTAADQMVDSPTNNYCTLNPLVPGTHPLSSGNLSFTRGGSQLAKGTLGVSSGKWYFEGRIDVDGGPGIAFGYEHVGGAYSYYQNNGRIYYDGHTPGILSTWAYTVGDVISVALDLDDGTIAYRRNNTLVDQVYSFPKGGMYIPYTQTNNIGDSGTINFGQSPFTYTPPSGFKALCTANLPAAPITKPGKHFNTVLYTGNGGTKAVTGMGFEPGLLWGKERSAYRNHFLQNKLAGPDSYLSSNNTAAEVLQHADGYVQSFDSDGFTVTAGSSSALTVNENNGAYVAWGWKAGGTPVTNTDGSITSQVSANPAAGFSIVKASIPASGVVTFGHGLGAIPAMLIGKPSSAAGAGQSWCVYHVATGATKALFLESTAGASNVSLWNSTSPTSSLITVNGSWAGVAFDEIFYVFAEIPGYSKFGSLNANGNTDGGFAYCDFRPKWILLFNTSGGNQWYLVDAVRDVSNVAKAQLYPSANNAESTATLLDILSNGFKLRTTAGLNAGSASIIYAAFAEHPFGGSNVAPSPAR